MNGEQDKTSDLGKMTIGAGIGLLFGIVLGTMVAWFSDSFANGTSWIVIPHIALVMTMTGMWTVPSFLSSFGPEHETSENEDHESIQFENGVSQPAEDIALT
ncbi:MAG: hypothetical protein KDA84_13420 [Planctomycetaceae bacterium]|nr:hypothetical protein [Planctomycetaceae bacterium]